MLLMLGLTAFVGGVWVKLARPDTADAGACSSLFGALGETGRR